MKLPGPLKRRWSSLLVTVLLCFVFAQSQAQSGLQRFDEHVLEQLAAGRTDGQTRVWRWVSDANNYVNAGIPLGVLVDGFIRNGAQTRRNGAYMLVSTASTYLLNWAIKQLVRRPRPFLTDPRLIPVQTLVDAKISRRGDHLREKLKG